MKMGRTKRGPIGQRGRPSWRNRSLEGLEPRVVLAGDPILQGQPLLISEFVADSNLGLATRTRTSAGSEFSGELLHPDWIELLNVSQQRVNIGGLHLTDDPAQPTKWALPAGTSLGAGEFLVLFASGEDIQDPQLDELGYLHTNFRLSGEGDYLALTNAAGQVVHEFAPGYPAQRVDVSYGIPMTTRVLLGPQAAVEYLVPGDDALEPAWRASGFTHPNLVASANPSPVGFDRGQGEPEPAETIGPELLDRPSADFSRGSIVVLESSPFRIAGRVSQWSFHSKVAQPLTPLVLRQVGEEYTIVGIGRTRTSDGTGAQTYDFELQTGSDLVEPEGYFFGFKDGDNTVDVPGVVRWSASEVDVVRRYNGPLSGRMTIDQTLGNGRDMQRSYSVQATTEARLLGPISTNLAAAMNGASSVYVRYPFQLAQRSTLRALTLRVRYEDGFVAYLNGTEVARRNVTGAPHFNSTADTNRSLAQANEYVDINISEFRDLLVEGDNVLAVHGLNDGVQSSDFLIDAELVGLDMASAAGGGFAAQPTPGAANGHFDQGFVSNVAFSQQRGFFTTPFALELATPGHPAASIYFTRDGSPPTPDNPQATLYTAAIAIDGTTNIRAASFEAGYLPSLPQTHSYLFPADIVQQALLSTVVTQDPVWGPQMIESLLAVPTVSLVTATDGIPVAGEHPVAVELIYPDGTTGFQTDAGIEVYGGTAVSFPKRSMRISFKKDYGPGQLEFDVFDDPDGVSTFDQLLLRPGSHDTPFWTGSTGAGTYLRNRWATDRQLEMGHLAPRSQYVQLYINGQYWGMHDLMERPNASFMAGNLGGETNDYDALNAGTAIDGDRSAWDNLLAAVGQSYETVKQYLDVVNYADYLLLEFYGGNNVDWGPASNWMAARKREAGAGFQFFAWDSDIILRSGATTDIVNYGGPGFLWTANGGMRQYPEFLDLLAERAQSHFFDGGIFTDERLRSSIDGLADEARLAVIAETARWGFGRYTPTTWEAAVDWIKETYAPTQGTGRAATVIEQLRRAGLYPLTDTPTLLVNGAPSTSDRIETGDTLLATTSLGDVYYTLDGSDPKADQPVVQLTSLIHESSAVRAFVPTDDTLASEWRQPGFDDGQWIAGSNGVGYGTGGEFAEQISLNLQAAMKDINSTAYVRLPFTLDNPPQFETLQLGIQYDDGFVAYLNGVEVARRNAPAVATWNSRSSIPRANVDAVVYEPFNLTPHLGLLRAGENVLAIHVLNSEPANLDVLIRPRLEAGRVNDTGASSTAQRLTAPILVPAGAKFRARAFAAGQWSPLRQANVAAPVLPLRISEIMYHPANPTAAEQAAGFTDADEFEFIELVNISNTPIDLDNVRFVSSLVNDQTEGIEFDFRQGVIHTLGPGETVLIVENTSAFVARYGDLLPIAGEWSGGLSNAQEQITLQANGTLLQQLTYRETWHPTTDGDGPSLEIISATDPDLGQWSVKSAWRPSVSPGGSPGQIQRPAAPGDANRDGLFDSRDLVLIFQAGKYEDQTPGNAVWEEGDWNGDGDFTTADLVLAFNVGGYVAEAIRAARRNDVTPAGHESIFAEWHNAAGISADRISADRISADGVSAAEHEGAGRDGDRGNNDKMKRSAGAID